MSSLRSPSFSGQLGLNVGAGFGLTGQVDVARSATGNFANGKSTDVAWYAGARAWGAGSAWPRAWVPGPGSAGRSYVVSEALATLILFGSPAPSRQPVDLG